MKKTIKRVKAITMIFALTRLLTLILEGIRHFG